MTTTHTYIAVEAGEPGRRHIVGTACSCGWTDDKPGRKAFSAHLKAEGVCPRCRNRGAYVETNGNHRYVKRCACPIGRTQKGK